MSDPAGETREAPPPSSRFPKLGRYRTLAKLGRGGMADVYLIALEGQLGVTKLLVAKVLRSELEEDEEFKRLFVEEARVAAQLDHPNLVQTIEVGESDGRHFIIMEYLDGRPLHHVIGRLGYGGLPLRLHARILARTLEGLHAAHEKHDFSGRPLEIVHRDVSPQNVFITFDGQVKLVDFGVAKVARRTVVTETGVLRGKLAYMAPEQALSEPTDRRADIFAVGVMLWEALTQRRFVDRSDGEAVILRKRITGEFVSPRVIAPDAPPELLSLCERAMAFDPALRFATAAEFAEALDRYDQADGERTRTKELGALVSKAFQEDRAQMRALIESQVGSNEELTLPAVDLGVEHLVSTNQVATVSQRTTEARLPRRPVYVLAAVALSVGIWGIARGFRGVPLAASSTSPSAMHDVLPPPAELPPMPSAEKIHLSVAATPPSAVLSLDDHPLNKNPFEGDIAVEAGSHILRAAAQGYLPTVHTISLDRNLQVELTLSPLPPRPTLAPARAPAASRPPSRTNSIRSVDERDPYSQ